MSKSRLATFKFFSYENRKVFRCPAVANIRLETEKMAKTEKRKFRLIFSYIL